MKNSTEEFLFFLLWVADSFLRPSWRNVDESFESWAYRSGFGRAVTRLEQQRFLELQQTTDLRRVYRLTAEGRRTALGGRDPVEHWERHWDGRWRLVVFDLPVRKSGLRTRLRRYFERHGYGHLQQSVWITPDPLDEAHRHLVRLPADAGSLILFEGGLCGKESDAVLVDAAWDFAAINARYEQHRAVVGECPGAPPPGGPFAAFWAWARRERAAWDAAVGKDPLLPRALLPADYGGVRSWELRSRAFHRFAPQSPVAFMMEGGTRRRGEHSPPSESGPPRATE